MREWYRKKRGSRWSSFRSLTLLRGGSHVDVWLFGALDRALMVVPHEPCHTT